MTRFITGTVVTFMLILADSARAETIVTVTTQFGSFDIEMLESDAPLTVQNFLGYVNRGDYNGTFIHRSVPGFVIQGGGYTYVASNNTAPHIPTQDPVVNEFKVSNTRGTVAMAKLGNDPDSATSEWFVNLADNSSNLDNQNGGFTVFGRVINNGMDVVDQIAALDRADLGGAFSTTPVVNFNGTITEEIFITITATVKASGPDFDGDGIIDADDTDDDNDGVADTEDAFPFDASETKDSDSDGTGDNADTDDDNDGTPDTADAFPVDANESKDTDGDGIGDNADIDRDGDGIANTSDSFPDNSREWTDSDGDGTGDNADEHKESLGYVYLMTNSASQNVTSLHIINTSDEPQQFTGTLFTGDGERLGSFDTQLRVRVVQPQGRLILSAADIETRFNTNAWSGPAMLLIKGTSTFEMMTKLTSPSGLISNTNCTRTDRVHNIEATGSSNRTFIRFINTGNNTISDIRGSVTDAAGNTVGTSNIQLVESLAAKAAVWVTQEELAEKTGTSWDSVVSLALTSSHSGLRLLNLNLVNGETFFNFSCFEDQQSARVYLMTNSASSNISETHIINTSSELASLTANLHSGDGNRQGNADFSLSDNTIAPGGRLVPRAPDLESRATTGVWSGPAVLQVAGGSSLELMTRLTSRSGLISNTNCVRQGAVHNIEGGSNVRTFVRFINQGDSDITNIRGTLYDTTGNQVGSTTTLLASLAARSAAWITRDEFVSLFGSWSNEASLVVTADSDKDLRLINLNLVNDETFFNFSCYETSTDISVAQTSSSQQ